LTWFSLMSEHSNQEQLNNGILRNLPFVFWMSFNVELFLRHRQGYEIATLAADN